MGMPRVGRPQRLAREEEGGGGRSSAPLGHHWAPRPPRRPCTAREPPRRSSEVFHGCMGTWHGGPSPRAQSRSRLGRRTQCHQLPALVLLPSGPVFFTSGREGRCLRTQRGPGGFRGTSLGIHCLRQDFLDFSPTPLPVDLNPAQGATESSAPLCVHAPPPFRASPQVQGQQGLGLPVLRRPTSWFLFLKSAPGNTCPSDPHNPAWQGQQAVPATGVVAQIPVPEMARAPFRLPLGPYLLLPSEVRQEALL